MGRKLFLNAALILVNLTYLSTIYAQPAPRVYKMPRALVNRLKVETEQRQRGDCSQKNREFASSQFYALTNDHLLLLIGLPDYFCNASSFMPVVINRLGNWNAGAVFESYPSFLLTDNKRQLWLISHWEIEGVYPLLHHSLDGVHWQEISLPKERKIDCCFQYLKQVCLSESQIQLKFTGMDDTPVEYWQTTVSDSLKAAPNWQKTNTEKIIPPPQCQTTALTSGDWQRKITPNGAKTSFQSAHRNLKVEIPRWLKVGH